jgi:hypothetical protein
MTFPLLTLKNIITFLFSIFILYNLLNILNHLSQETSLLQLPIQNIQGQLQQPQTDYIKYEYQSDYIKEFEISQIVNETGLKGITIDSKNNAWFFHNTNTSSAIIEFNPVNNTFIKYPITKKTNVDNAITNLAGGQLTFDETRNSIWFSDARTNSLGMINLVNKKMTVEFSPTFTRATLIASIMLTFTFDLNASPIVDFTLIVPVQLAIGSD